MKRCRRTAAVILAVALLVGVFSGVSVVAANRASAQQQQTGVTVYQNEKASIDASNLAEGYLLVKYSGGKNVRVRLQTIKENGETYTYDLNNTGKVETIPLTEGNGTYTVRVLENTSGDKYAIALSQPVKMTLRSDFLPFLYANQYVNFNKDSAVVKTAAGLISGKTKDVDKLTAIYEYVVKNFTYDTEKAKNVASGYLPVVDTVLANKKGICFDYAAVMAAMLRSQNIPCKLVVGYADTTYHAWVNAYIDGEWVEAAIYYNGVKWFLLDPTFVSSGKESSEVMQFVGNVKNYSQKYAY